MREIMMKTCIKFVQRTNQKDFIYILSEKGKGCSSHIGRVGIGRQDLHIESISGD